MSESTPDVVIKPAESDVTRVASVFSAISRVMADLAKQGIGKTQQNTQDRYMYRGIDGLYNVMGPTLSRHGLVILPTISDIERKEKQTRSGSTIPHVIVRVKYLLVDSGSGDRIEIVHFGEAVDAGLGDKGIKKALSNAYTSLCYQLFAIPLVGQDDPDADQPSYDGDEVVGVISDEDAARIKGLLEATDSNVKKFLAAFSIESVEALSTSQLPLAQRMLDRKAADMKAGES